MSQRGHVLFRLLAAVVLGAVIVGATSGCAGRSDPPSPSSTPTAHVVTAAQAERLATVGLNMLRAKTQKVTGSIVSGDEVITLRGWLDAADHTGYALVSSPHGAGFLTVWNATDVSAQDFTGTAPPLPRPEEGWSTMPLSAQSSALAAAQLVLVGLASDRPENPQLLIQGRAQWLRSDSVGGVKVDVMSGPVAEGASVSNLRYWVDRTGVMHRLEARLDGRNWSRFDFTPASGVTF